MINIAALRGTTSEYEILDDYNVLLRREGRHTIIDMKLFNELYTIVNQFGEAALKDDCIEFVVHVYDKPLEHYPEWYKFAVKCYVIFKIGSDWFFYNDPDEIPIYDGDIILRNSRGELRYLSKMAFTKIYQI